MRLRLPNYSPDFISLYIVLNLNYQAVQCNPITNSKLSERVREFSAKEDDINSTKVQTLHKEKPEYYANFTPTRSFVKFKETPDSVLSSSSYSRGLVTHEHPGYSFHEYEDEPHYYGNDYHIPDSNHHGYPQHNVEHYNYGHHDGHQQFGHHYNNYNHGLAAKTVLWPIAGLALLSAAAALITNPVLLQIGVATGKRRRRDTEEVFDSDIGLDRKRWEYGKFIANEEGPDLDKEISQRIGNNNPVNISLKTKQMTFLRNKRINQVSVQGIDVKKPIEYIREPDEQLLPVPLITHNVE